LKLQLTIDGKTYEAEVEVLEEDPAPRPRGYLPPHAPPSTLRSLHVPPEPAAAPADGPVDEAHVCRSPMAGVVARIKARPGQVLARDDLIMVLEAMKMETNVTASVAGTVRTIKVAEGDGVRVNQVLVEFEH
jgi:methylmalonyl-CoA carboxyltransferase small subunit